ncbi:glutamine synthetase (plasmid) [Paracoccus liaowanqingii]|uniref:Glutamine synthetase n=1 Tax=Paracoccus liaowanqingii TaxID=2560053 RepID=A0A4Y5SSH6_9RHOB|nr:glutamine synthetase family protein [Paracoccus liaowanqingii]QDA35893.1 glutamine synthetase [Paracoccus liaowanqingii]
MTMSPTGALVDEAQSFLDANSNVAAVDISLADLHGIGRGKMIRRHELLDLFCNGRGMPASLFAQDIEGNDVPGAIATQSDGGGDSLCWPVAGTLGRQHNGRGLVLLQMFDRDGAPIPHDPRGAMLAQITRARYMGFQPMGALELEFYLLDAAGGPARALLGGRCMSSTNCMSVDELDEMSPFFDAVYAAATPFDLSLESLLSEYAPGQFELTLRYRDLARAADDIILTKQILRSTARRFGMRACFMPKPFAGQSGSGMHLHLSLTDPVRGMNLFADQNGATSLLMLQAIGGVRAAMADTMLVLGPTLNSWRRLGAAIYSPTSNSWGRDDRNVALRIPNGSPASRHFEHRVAGVDANPYLVAAVILGTALDGIEASNEPGPQYSTDGAPALPRSWTEAIESFGTSCTMRRILGEDLHAALAAIKRQECARLADHVSDIEWQLYADI